MKTKSGNKTKCFSTPKPILSRGEPKSKNLDRVKNQVKTSKSKTQTSIVLTRPYFKKHVCEREDDCHICRNYINNKTEWRKTH